MATVSLRQLRKTFGTVEVVQGIDLDIADGAGYLKDHEAALKELGVGLKLYTNSAALRIALGSLHLKDEAFDQAFAVLMHPSTRQHP